MIAAGVVLLVLASWDDGHHAAMHSESDAKQYGSFTSWAYSFLGSL